MPFFLREKRRDRHGPAIHPQEKGSSLSPGPSRISTMPRCSNPTSYALNDGSAATPIQRNRLWCALALLSLATTLPLSAVLSVLLPAKIGVIAPQDKISVLALVSTGAAIAGMIGAISAGALSDRTQGRYGRRNPWLLGWGGLVAVATVMMAAASNRGMLLVSTSLGQIGINGMLVVTSAVVPDRVAAARFGTANACIGVGQLLGLALGTMWGSHFLAAPDQGLLWLAAMPVVGALAFVLIAPESPAPRMPQPLSHPLKSLLPPAHASDFYWAAGARLMLVLGTTMVLNYQLYILTDYMRQPDRIAAAALSAAAVAYLIGALIGSALGGPLSDRIGRRKGIVIGSSMLIAGSTLFLLFWPVPWAMSAYKVFNGMGFGVYLAVHSALATEVLPNSETRGKDLSFLNIANNLGNILAPAAATLSLSAPGGYATLFTVAITLCAASTLLIVPIRSSRVEQIG